MRTFIVKVRTSESAFSYPALAHCSADLISAAFVAFADVQTVFVTPRGAA